MPSTLLRLQLAAACANPRRWALRLGIVCLLAMPFVLVDMPPRAQAAGVVMVILFTTFFGTAVGHMRLRSDGRLERLKLLPIPRAILWLDIMLASLLDRLIPAAIVPLAFVIVNGRAVTPAAMVQLAGLLCGSLLLLTVLAVGTARLARDNGEVHLFGALACGVLALLAGVVPLPERLLWLKTAASWNPLGQLSAALTHLADGAADITPRQLIGALAILGMIAITTVLRWGRRQKSPEGTVYNGRG